MGAPADVSLHELDTQYLGKQERGIGLKAGGLIENVVVCIWIPRFFSRSLQPGVFSSTCPSIRVRAHTHRQKFIPWENLTIGTEPSKTELNYKVEPSIAEKVDVGEAEFGAGELSESLQN